jgi:hypothetical protein
MIYGGETLVEISKSMIHFMIRNLVTKASTTKAPIIITNEFFRTHNHLLTFHLLVIKDTSIVIMNRGCHVGGPTSHVSTHLNPMR